MKIGLIAMSGVRVRDRELAELGVTLPGFVRRGEVIASLPSLGLLTVAGLTPPEHKVCYLEVDELQTFTDWPDFDLVGISSLSARIDEAYAVAAAYRDRGIPVVMGGLHVSALPEEALEHCDAVVINGAEGAWPKLLTDAAKGRLQRRYVGATADVFNPPLYSPPRFDLLAQRPYNRFTVQSSRGCPRRCDFCGASLHIVSGFVQKPVSLVVEEIRAARKHFHQPFLEFADDNTFLDRRWGKDLLTQLLAEDIHWFTETDAAIADDPDFCDLLAPAGCRQLLIGFESPQATDLQGMDPADWKRRRAPAYRRVIDTLQSRGVSVNGCFILGLDNHTPEIFPLVRDFVRESGLAEVQCTVLTPFPGTPLHERLRREQRLINEQDWSRCTLFDVNFRPARMSVAELEAGIRWLFAELYSPAATRQRKRDFIAARRTRSGVPATSR